MERVLEPEVMDGQEQSEAYAAADFASVNEAFVERFCGLFPWWSSGEALDLGCGPADIPLRLARRVPGARVLGVDASGPMLALGQAALEAAGVAGRVRLQEALLPAALGPARSFGAVISNSLLHHLPEPAVLWEAVARYGAPGAAVMVVDLLRPASEEEAQALVETYAVGEPAILRHDFFHSLLAAFRPAEVEAQVAAAGLAEALAVEVISDRHLLVWGRLPG